MRIRMVFDFSSAKLNVTVGEKVLVSSKGKGNSLPKYQGQVWQRHIFGYAWTQSLPLTSYSDFLECTLANLRQNAGRKEEDMGCKTHHVKT